MKTSERAVEERRGVGAELADLREVGEGRRQEREMEGAIAKLGKFP